MITLKHSANSLSWWKKKAWAIRSLRVRTIGKRTHKYCRICLWEAAKKNNCKNCSVKVRPIEVAAHIVPKSRGNSIYFDLRNLYGCCIRHNYAEKMNRSLYRDIHIEIFGKDLVEGLERQAHEIKKFTRLDYRNMIEEDRQQMETK